MPYILKQDGTEREFATLTEAALAGTAGASDFTIVSRPERAGPREASAAGARLELNRAIGAAEECLEAARTELTRPSPNKHNLRLARTHTARALSDVSTAMAMADVLELFDKHGGNDGDE
jgi:hypothetical protein